MEEPQKMPRLNEVILTGIIREKPVMKKDPNTGDIAYGVAELVVARGRKSRKSGHSFLVTANPSIISADPQMYRKIETLEPWDVVQVKGFVATKRVRKPSTCPHCETRNIAFGEMGYISPIHIKKLGHKETEAEALDALMEHTELSNCFSSMGNVTMTPERVTVHTERSGDIKLCQFQIALIRTIRVREDKPLKRADFPWVKTYGAACDETYYRLHKNSTVYITGFLQTRRIRRKTECPACGEKYEWIDRTLEIVPYRSEYLLNCRTTEEVETIRLSESEQNFQMQTATFSNRASYGDEVLDEKVGQGA